MPQKLTQEDFIKKAKAVHGDMYDYSKTTYVNAHTPITIICSVHGEFTQKACNHTNARQGCPKCSGNTPYTTEEYIAKAAKIHDNKYLYNETEYHTAHSSITVTCPIHGNFKQKAYVHLQGHGCPKCASTARVEKTEQNMWSYSGWEEAGVKSKYFDEFRLYVIECWKDGESFIKIGKTFTTLNRRFVKGALPYEWKLLYTEVGSAGYISSLEKSLHNKYKNLKYVPTKAFNGMKECYTLKLKDILNENDRGATENS